MGLLVAIVCVQSLAISGLSSLVPAYLHHAGAGDFLVGLSFTAWAVTRGASGLVAGRIYGRFGARRLLVAALALFAVTTLGYALDHAPVMLVALRLGQGVAAGLFWTPLLAATAQVGPPEGRLRALTLVNVTYAATGLASNLLAGNIAAGLSPAAFFWMECALLALVGVPLALRLRVAEGAGAGGRGEAAAADGAVGHGRAAGAATSAPASPALGPRQWVQAALAAVAGLPVVVTAVGAPVLLMRAGAGYRVVGLVVAAMVLANIVAQAPAHRLAARWGEGRVLAVLGGVAGALLVALPFAHGVGAVTALVIPLSGALALTALTWLSWAQSGVPRGAIGALTGLMRGVGDLTMVLAFTAFGFIAGHLGPSLWGLAGLAVATGVGALWVAGQAGAEAAGGAGRAGEAAEAVVEAAD